jgi:hypothetical protein
MAPRWFETVESKAKRLLQVTPLRIHLGPFTIITFADTVHYVPRGMA